LHYHKHRRSQHGGKLGETDSWKNLKAKISWHCPFKSCRIICISMEEFICPWNAGDGNPVWRRKRYMIQSQSREDVFPSRETFPALPHIFKYPCQTENTKSRNIRQKIILSKSRLCVEPSHNTIYFFMLFVKLNKKSLLYVL
jgi:hypothetical protein